MELNGQPHAPAALGAGKLVSVLFEGGWLGPTALREPSEKRQVSAIAGIQVPDRLRP